jgi:hypothetical protein
MQTLLKEKTVKRVALTAYNETECKKICKTAGGCLPSLILSIQADESNGL